MPTAFSNEYTYLITLHFIKQHDHIISQTCFFNRRSFHNLEAKVIPSLYNIEFISSYYNVSSGVEYLFVFYFLILLHNFHDM